MNKSSQSPDSISVHFKFGAQSSPEKWHVKSRLPHDPEPPMTLAAFVYIQNREYRVAENGKEISQLLTSRRAHKARTCRGLSTIILSSSPLPVSNPSPGSSKYVMRHHRCPLDIPIPGNSSMESTPDPPMRRRRGLPRRDYALHNGLLSSSSKQCDG